MVNLGEENDLRVLLSSSGCYTMAKTTAKVKVCIYSYLWAIKTSTKRDMTLVKEI